MTNPTSIVIMGVSGAGKTTVGRRLAERLNGSFIDGDDFHSTANIEKMTMGQPLTDEDRGPWLDRIIKAIANRTGDSPVVVACSALKASYRRRLTEAPCQIVYLKGTQEQIAQRVSARTGHFMSADLLKSQFEALEEPDDALVVSIDGTVDEIVDSIIQSAGLNHDM